MKIQWWDTLNYVKLKLGLQLPGIDKSQKVGMNSPQNRPYGWKILSLNAFWFILILGDRSRSCSCIMLCFFSKIEFIFLSKYTFHSNLIHFDDFYDICRFKYRHCSWAPSNKCLILCDKSAGSCSKVVNINCDLYSYPEYNFRLGFPS